MAKKNLRTKRIKKAPFKRELFELIDGNFSHHPAAYCRWKKGWLSEGLIHTHNCRTRKCDKLEEGVNVDEGQ